MKVLRTKKGAAAADLGGFGYLEGDGGNGVSIEDLAARGMLEFQELDESGEAKRDEKTGAYVPLTGAALDRAAKEYAKMVSGGATTIEVAEIADDREAGLRPLDEVALAEKREED